MWYFPPWAKPASLLLPPQPCCWGQPALGHAGTVVLPGTARAPLYGDTRGDPARRSEDCCQAQGCTLKGRRGGSSARPRCSKIKRARVCVCVSHLKPPLSLTNLSWGTLAGLGPGSEAAFFSSWSRSRAQQPRCSCKPSCEPRKHLPVFGRE